MTFFNQFEVQAPINSSYQLLYPWPAFLIDNMGTTKIRAAGRSDLESIMRIYRYYTENTAVTFDDVPDPELFVRRLSAPYPFLVADDGEVAGYAYAARLSPRKAYDWSVEVSIYLDPSKRRNGLGSRLYGVLEDELKRMGAVNAYACITVPVEGDPRSAVGSIPFHLKRGYSEVGRFPSCGYKFGRWYDIVWLAKGLGPHSVPQPDLLPWDAEAFGTRILRCARSDLFEANPPLYDSFLPSAGGPIIL